MPFISAGDGDLKSTFITDAWLIDQFVGNRLLGCGRNLWGQLGDNTTSNRSSFTQTVAVGTNWKQSACGIYHEIGIKTDGTLWLWGANYNGALGDNTTSHRSSPVQTIAGGTNWMTASCGLDHTAAIKTDGTLWTWGKNSYGQLGDNTRTHRSSPVQTISGGTNWKQVSCGNNHTAGIKTDGTLWIWGQNSYGQLGDNTRTHRSSPVQTISGGTNWKQVSSSGFINMAAKTDGTLWLWGYNFNGQVGDNTTANKSSPVQTVTGGTNWKYLGAGTYFNSAIKTDGTLWLWGYNAYGQLGTNSLTNVSSPVQTVVAGTNWKQVSLGSQHVAAVKNDGSIWSWGYNYFGSLGDQTIIHKSSPIQTGSNSYNWKWVACGSYMSVAVTYGD